MERLHQENGPRARTAVAAVSDAAASITAAPTPADANPIIALPIAHARLLMSAQRRPGERAVQLPVHVEGGVRATLRGAAGLSRNASHLRLTSAFLAGEGGAVKKCERDPYASRVACLPLHSAPFRGRLLCGCCLST